MKEVDTCHIHIVSDRKWTFCGPSLHTDPETFVPDWIWWYQHSKIQHRRTGMDKTPKKSTIVTHYIKMSHSQLSYLPRSLK